MIIIIVIIIQYILYLRTYSLENAVSLTSVQNVLPTKCLIKLLISIPW